VVAKSRRVSLAPLGFNNN
jgi:hypothetical protein